ncbi:uncharacterized protein LOC111391442 [Olea europaea var. sylvestris]|uniref:Uncharacterized protein n=1 Tax=Olea europaea subsp. europaea TaxID=158383 RepID=A0A8S0PG99_OLEEU|nr:uncharacterized protein LOC111391442 [Olea europaea var. sylvestris]CAA2945568.1 Hypothetical predicted protein [Olea europaea subsp. europaea]
MTMASSSALLIFNKGLLLSTRQLSSSNFHSSSVFIWGSKRNQDVRLISQRTKSQEIRVLANPNVSPDRRNSNKEVIMVDPLEAKRLAAKQMEKIKAKDKFKKRRQIEAINGAWAMIGLTAGLVIEGHTGNTILAQLAGYWTAFIGFFVR